MILEPFNPTSENQDGNDQCGHQQAESIKNGNEEEAQETVSHIPDNSTGEEKSGATSNAIVVSNAGDNASSNLDLIVLDSVEQGSTEWHDRRRGCVTMSNAKALLSGGKGLTRKSYLMSVASEIITGVTADAYKSWLMERGNILEPYARMAFTEHTGIELKQVGLGYLNNRRRISASPDGLSISSGAEIKCQLPKNHLATLINGVNPKEFAPQMNGCMWLFGRERWDYVSFCPEFTEMPLFVHTVYRDEEMIKRIEESAQNAVYEIDQFVKAGTAEQASDKIVEICEDALLTIETLSNKEPDFM